MSEYRGYIIHDGLLLGQDINGYTLSDEAKQYIRENLPGTPVCKNLVPSDDGYVPDGLLGTVLLLEGKLVARFIDPLNETVAATMRPALSFIVETDEETQMVTKINSILGVALVAKEEGDLGYLEPYPKLK